MITSCCQNGCQQSNAINSCFSAERNECSFQPVGQQPSKFAESMVVMDPEIEQQEDVSVFWDFSSFFFLLNLLQTLIFFFATIRQHSEFQCSGDYLDIYIGEEYLLRCCSLWAIKVHSTILGPCRLSDPTCSNTNTK